MAGKKLTIDLSGWCYLMQMFGFPESTNPSLVMAISVHWYGHILMREAYHISRTLEFGVTDKRR